MKNRQSTIINEDQLENHSNDLNSNAQRLNHQGSDLNLIGRGLDMPSMVQYHPSAQQIRNYGSVNIPAANLSAPINLSDTSSSFHQQHSNSNLNSSFQTVDNFYQSSNSLPPVARSNPSSKAGSRIDQIIGEFLASLLGGFLVLFGLKKMKTPASRTKSIKELKREGKA